MTFDEACAKAPKWATHISVLKHNGEAKYYNNRQGLSQNIGGKDGGFVHKLSEDYTEMLFLGEREWNLVPIPAIELENK